MSGISIGQCGACGYFERKSAPLQLAGGAEESAHAAIGSCLNPHHAATALRVSATDGCLDFSTDIDAASLSSARLPAADRAHGRDFLLQKVQPALLGLMDGSVSTLAPIFAAAGLTGRSLSAFFVGVAASVGAGISMGLAEALSDDGKVTGRGTPLLRGGITGFATALGGMLHTLPFLIPNLHVALRLAYAVVVVELLAIAYIRFRFMKTPLAKTVVQVIVGGGIVFLIGVWLGKIGAG
jgi:erythrin-vacuolar iron transport family protein